MTVKREIEVTLTAEEVEKLIKSIPLADVLKNLDASKVIDTYDTESVLQCLDNSDIKDYLISAGYFVSDDLTENSVTAEPKIPRMNDKFVEEALQDCYNKFVDPLKIAQALEALIA